MKHIKIINKPSSKPSVKGPGGGLDREPGCIPQGR